MLKAFLQQRNQDTDRISLEQYNKEIDEALAEVEAGKLYYPGGNGKKSRQMVREVRWPLSAQQ